MNSSASRYSTPAGEVWRVRVQVALQRLSPMAGWAGLALILSLAAGLRFYRLDGQSLWSDEGNSAALALRSFSQIAHDAAADIHPPLYYWLLAGWVRIFGASEIGLRSLSALLGVALVAVIFASGRRWAGFATGLGAALLATLSPLQVVYAQEARMYMLLALCAGLATWGALEFQAAALTSSATSTRTPQVRWLALVALSTALGLYTHYSFPLFLIALNLAVGWWLLETRHQPQLGQRAGQWTVTMLVALIAFLPWLPTATGQITRWPQVRPSLDAPGALLTALQWLGPGPTTPTPNLLAWLAVWVACVGGVLAWRRPPKSYKLQIHSVGFLPAILLVVPLALLLALRLFQASYFKFLLALSPAYCLLIAGAWFADKLQITKSLQGANYKLQITNYKLRITDYGLRITNDLWSLLKWIAFIAFAVLLAWSGLNGYYNNPRYARDDYRAIAQYIAAVGRPGDAVILDAPGQQEVFAYYSRANLPVYPLPGQRPVQPIALVSDLTRITDTAHGRIFAIFWATDESDPQGLVESWLDEHAYKALDGWQGNLRFVVYGLPQANGPERSLQVTLGDTFRWQSVAIQPNPVQVADVLQIGLRWQRLGAVPAGLKLFLQLLDNRDQIVSQRDVAVPVGADTLHEGILIAPGTPPGTYRLIGGLYLASGQRLAAVGADAGPDYANLGPIQVQPAPAPLPLAAFDLRQRTDIFFAGLRLLGYEYYRRSYRHAPDTPLHPGDMLHISLLWQADVAGPDRKMKIGLAGTPVALEAEPAGPGYPLARWSLSERVRGEHDLLLPADLHPGTYDLMIDVLNADGSSVRPTRLGTVTVSAP